MTDGPTFDHPPVVEVVLGVQYEPLDGQTVPVMARYWEVIRDRFPTWKRLAPLPAVFEVFGAPAPRPVVSFNLASAPGPSRSMFVDKDAYYLIQVQHDRFVHNWRKHEDHEAPYPRYPLMREKFEAALREYVEFVTAAGVGAFVPNQCEVTYVNHMVAGLGWENHGQLGAILEGYSGACTDDFLDKPEGVDLNLRYVIRGERGSPVGRLHVSARPVFRVSDGTPLFRIDLTARTRVVGGGVESVLAELDRGHSFLVNAFRSLTTEEMHARWGLRQ